MGLMPVVSSFIDSEYPELQRVYFLFLLFYLGMFMVFI